MNLNAAQTGSQVIAVLMSASKLSVASQAFDALATDAMLLVRNSDGLLSLQSLTAKEMAPPRRSQADPISESFINRESLRDALS
jgi:hypothetical protein